LVYNPLTLLLTVVFVFLLVFLFIMVQINVIALAFVEMGIPGEYVFTALLAILLGSFVNIPITQLRQQQLEPNGRTRCFGMTYIIPVWRRPQVTLVAVNLGGAVIPALLCIYLLASTGLWLPALLATLLMAVVAYSLARPVRGIGIALPAFIPPVAAALIALILAYDQAPTVAYVGGTLGTLIGADLLNLRKIPQLGAPVASIGGAGTFDGIFLNGILAVLLSSILT
jgi:uncharacterized membrane protein